mgnify:CR=1 FL=1
MEKIIFNTNYSINTKGKVKNIETGRYLTETKKENGYMRYALCINGKSKFYYTHRLLGYAFLNLTNELHIDHLNGNRSDNRIENLEVVTQLENNRRSRVDNGLPDYIRLRKARKGRSARYEYLKEGKFYSSTDLSKVISFKHSFEAIVS